MQSKMPGTLPKIKCTHVIPPLPLTSITFFFSAKTNRIKNRCTHLETTSEAAPSQRSTRLNPMSIPRFCNTQIISQEALNHLLMDDIQNDATNFTPTKLMQVQTAPVDFEHFAMPMIQPVTGETISSYKKLMNDPATAEIWMTAFGKDFGSMCQGNDKTGQKGTNVMFVMDPTDVPNIPKGRVVTYARVVVNNRPQKEDLN
jgi:hypothetical protein